MFLVLSHANMSVNHQNTMQCNVWPIPGQFDTPTEAKVDNVKAKCQIILASLSLVWQGNSIIVYGQNALILDNDIDLIKYVANICRILSKFHRKLWKWKSLLLALLVTGGMVQWCIDKSQTRGIAWWHSDQ